MIEPVSLDDLFAMAKKSINVSRAAAATAAKRGIRVKDKDDAAAPPADALFQNPDNWTRTKGVALIHEDTETLLGNFSEYVHKTVPSARKLVREDSPILITATEKVTGDWWIAEREEVAPVESWHQRKEAVVHLLLEKLGVHSPATPVSVLLSYGAVARVELQVETTFAQIEGAPVQLLLLPAGTNVLPVMAMESKMEVKAQVME
jgi:hypothetical protein